MELAFTLALLAALVTLLSARSKLQYLVRLLNPRLALENRRLVQSVEELPEVALYLGGYLLRNRHGGVRIQKALDLIQLGLPTLKSDPDNSYNVTGIRVLWEGLEELARDGSVIEGGNDLAPRQVARSIEYLSVLVSKISLARMDRTLAGPQTLCINILTREEITPILKVAAIRHLVPFTAASSSKEDRARLVDALEVSILRELETIPAMGDVFVAALNAIQSLSLLHVKGVERLLELSFRSCENAPEIWCQDWAISALAVYREENQDILSREVTRNLAERIEKKMGEPGGRRLRVVLRTKPLQFYTKDLLKRATELAEKGDQEAARDLCVRAINVQPSLAVEGAVSNDMLRLRSRRIPDRLAVPVS